eukprot:m.1104297 g.1104297  ORF g.1104297 m.1104297 type:complete len:52 (+) comp24335_c0_seq43:1379-1534(+)
MYHENSCHQTNPPISGANSKSFFLPVPLRAGDETVVSLRPPAALAFADESW